MTNLISQSAVPAASRPATTRPPLPPNWVLKVVMAVTGVMFVALGVAPRTLGRQHADRIAGHAAAAALAAEEEEDGDEDGGAALEAAALHGHAGDAGDLDHRCALADRSCAGGSELRWRIGAR